MTSLRVLSLVGSVLLTGLLAGGVRAAPPAQTPTEVPLGAITGQVKNATTQQPVGGLSVTLRRWQQDSELSPLTTTAAADGTFRFDQLDAGANAFYQAQVTFQDVAFPSQFVSFEPNTSQLSLPINLYDTTDSPADISIDRLHFIIMAQEPGYLSVLELYQFSNLDSRAYIGSLDKEGKRETVRIALPAGAQDLSLQAGELGTDFLQKDSELVATAAVMPGPSSFSAAFVYRVPFSGSSIQLDRVLHYDTATINGLLMDMGATLQSQPLTLVGERAAQDKNFFQYSSQPLKAGTLLPLRLGNLDKIQFTPPSGPSDAAGSAELGDTSQNSQQSVLLWVMLALGGLSVAFGLAYPRLRPRLHGEAAGVQVDPAVARQRLLLTMARLDEAFQGGQLGEAAYRRARAHRKSQLAALWRQGEEE